ncbi:MAG: PqqD family protein [Acholeplasma sp.]|nr:PqqD family protein [Acholeplasma sp.]
MSTYQIAGINISLKPLTKAYFDDTLKPYIHKGPSDYEIKSSLVDGIKPIEDRPIMHEKHRFFYEIKGQTVLQVLNQSNEIKYQITTSDDYKTQEIAFVKGRNSDLETIEYILFSMSFLEVMMREGFLPIHASCLVLNEEAILFSAPSKTGKTTHVKYYLDTFDHAINLNDDKPLIKDGYVYGTPFSGKTKTNVNAKFKLKALCFIKQGKINEIHRLDHDEAILHLLKNMLRPSKESVWNQMIPILNEVLKNPIYQASLTNEQKSIYQTYYGFYREANMRIKEGFKLKEIGSKIMVLPTDNEALNFNGIMTLNPSGKQLFEALLTEQTIDSLKQVLIDHYEVSEEEALKDVVSFIETLKKHHVLV